MSERQEKKRRIEAKLRYLQALELWLDKEPVWWNIFAHRKWRASRPQLDRR